VRATQRDKEWRNRGHDEKTSRSRQRNQRNVQQSEVYEERKEGGQDKRNGHDEAGKERKGLSERGKEEHRKKEEQRGTESGEEEEREGGKRRKKKQQRNEEE